MDAIVSSILFPYHQDSNTMTRRRQVRLPCTWVDEDEVPRISLPIDQEQDQVELLKEAIENLKKEKEKLEETDGLVKKSIQIVARKRLLAQQKKQDYIIINSEWIPTQEEMKEAGLEGWEWVTAY